MIYYFYLIFYYRRLDIDKNRLTADELKKYFNIDPVLEVTYL